MTYKGLMAGFISLLLAACGSDSDSEPTFMEGSWIGPCEDYSEDGTSYGQSTFTFNGENVTILNRTFDSTDCEGSNYISILETAGNIAIGDDVILATTGETVTQFVINVTKQTLIYNTQANVDDKNNESECGYSDWSIGIEKDVLTCRFGDTPTILGIALIDGEELYFGEVPEDDGYPSELAETPFTQL